LHKFPATILLKYSFFIVFCFPKSLHQIFRYAIRGVIMMINFFIYHIALNRKDGFK